MSDGDAAPPSEPRAGAELERVVDPALLAAVEKIATRLVLQPYALPLYAREPKLHVDPVDWRAGQISMRERDNFSNEMLNDLKELAPQANLRDLYRPVRSSVWHERELRTDEHDPGARRALAEAREAQHREPLPRVEPSVRAVVAEQRARRRFLAERWQPAKPDDAPRDAIETA